MHSIESGTRISVALFLSLSFMPDSMDNCNSSSMPKEKTKQAISLPMDKDTKTATSLPMLKEKIKLVPCVLCLQLPRTKTDFSHWFRQMAKYECSLLAPTPLAPTMALLMMDRTRCTRPW